MFDDQETHYPVPGETPWERLRYLATSTETIYPAPPYVCMKCRRVIVRGNGRSFCTIWRNSSAISGCLASGSGRPSGSPRRNRSRSRPLRCSCCACAAAPLAYAAIPWVLDIPDDPDAQFYAWATQKSVAYLRFFLRMLPVIAIFILP